jgi:aminoglycoside phosphotransferase (APT) family kinase protein
MSQEIPGLDRGALISWFDSEGLSSAASGTVVEDVALLPGGRSNLTYRINLSDGREVVLRRPPLGHVMPSAHDMPREFRVLQGLNSVGFPAPRVLALCESADVIGSPFLLMEFVRGRIFRTADDSRALDIAERRQASRGFVKGLSWLHTVEPSKAGLESFGRSQGFLERQVGRWAKQWEITKTAESEGMDELLRRLNQKLPEINQNPRPTVVHGDYRLDNIVLSEDFSEIRAVLDWEMAALGDPVLDLAVSLVYWTESSDTLRRELPVAASLTSSPGFLKRSEIVEIYASEHSLDEAHLDFCAVLACYKLGVIMESIRFRNDSGQQLGTGAGESASMGRAVSALASIGLAITEQGTLEGLSS